MTSEKSNAPPSPGLTAAPLRSMTGYAVVRRQTAAGELTLSLRSVNHRGLDLQFHQSSDMAMFENAIRSVIKRQVARGHVEVRMFLTREEATVRASYNRVLVARYVEAFRAAAKELGLQGAPDLNNIMSLPGVLNGEAEPKALDPSFAAEVTEAATLCVRELNKHREREASDLLAAFTEAMDRLEQNTAAMKEIRKNATEQFRDKLVQRLQELLGETGIAETRLLEEAAMLADRSDVEEELIRLAVHLGELRTILQGGGEVGKRIDFLLQEMNRETNTILSKTSGIGEIGLTVTNLALASKAHIEKIREQALNLE